MPSEEAIASETVVGLDERLIHVLEQFIRFGHIEKIVQSANAAFCTAIAQGILARIERHTSLTDRIVRVENAFPSKTARLKCSENHTYTMQVHKSLDGEIGGKQDVLVWSSTCLGGKPSSNAPAHATVIWLAQRLANHKSLLSRRPPTRRPSEFSLRFSEGGALL